MFACLPAPAHTSRWRLTDAGGRSGLQKSDAQLCDEDQVHQFLQVHLLHWLEALGWMAKTSEGNLAIFSLEAQIPVSLLCGIFIRKNLD